MKLIQPEPSQIAQRIRVGMTGLLIVLALIALGSAIFSSARDDGTVQAIGAPKPDVVANMTAPENVTAAAASDPIDEPLADLGVAPSAATAETGNANKIAAQIAAEKQKDSSKVH